MQEIKYTSNHHKHMPGRRTSGKSAPHLLSVLTVLLLISAAATLGVFLADRVVAPALQRSAVRQALPVRTLVVETVRPSAAAPTATPKPAAQSVAKTIEFAQIDCYLLQAGAFSTQEAAQNAALEVQQTGGAGYIWPDTRLRVLAQLYTDAQHAQLAVQQWTQQGRDCYLYPCTIGGLSMDVSGLACQVEALEDAYQAWLSALEQTSALCDGLASSRVTCAQGVLTLRQIGKNLDDAAQALSLYTNTVQDESGVLEGLAEFCTLAAQDVQALGQADTLPELELCARARYLGIQWLERWRGYIDRVSLRTTAARQSIAQQ